MKTIKVSIFFTVLVMSAIGYTVLPRGKTIPSFQLSLLNGKTTKIEVNKGKLFVRINEGKKNKTLQPKAIIIDFWATWCGPCRITSKMLTELHRRHQGKGLFILGVSVDEGGLKVVESFLKKHPTPYSIALDPKYQVAFQFDVLAIPTIYLVNSKGAIEAVYEGVSFTMQKDIENKLREMGVK